MEFLDPLQGDPDHILAVAPTTEGPLAVWKTDLHTGAAEMIEKGDDDTLSWVTDRSGALIARYRLKGRTLLIEGRAPGESAWSLITQIKKKEWQKEAADFEILGDGPTPATIYVSVRPRSPTDGFFDNQVNVAPVAQRPARRPPGGHAALSLQGSRRSPKGPLPLIVMPHGGPMARDNFDFDSWSQFLAQWGGLMQDDITDGVKALIAAGLADPHRICVFGASYGGYSALMQGALHPELYRCVVSWAGTPTPSWRPISRGTWNGRSSEPITMSASSW